MNIIDILPTKIYAEILDQELTKKNIRSCMSYISKKGNLVKNVNNFHSKDRNIIEHLNLSYFQDTFISKSNEYMRNTLGYEYDHSFITQSWLNVSNHKQTHHSHYHPNSIVSGVFYIEQPNTDDDFYFTKFESSRLLPHIPYNPEIENTWQELHMSIEKNSLILFPSHVPHGVKQNNQNTSRITLSFNVMINRLGIPGTLNELRFDDV